MIIINYIFYLSIITICYVTVLMTIIVMLISISQYPSPLLPLSTYPYYLSILIKPIYHINTLNIKHVFASTITVLFSYLFHFMLLIFYLIIILIVNLFRYLYCLIIIDFIEMLIMFVVNGIILCSFGSVSWLVITIVIVVDIVIYIVVIFIINDVANMWSVWIYYLFMMIFVIVIY